MDQYEYLTRDQLLSLIRVLGMAPGDERRGIPASGEHAARESGPRPAPTPMPQQPGQRLQEFESLAENLPDLVARYDRERRFLYVNSAIEKVLGLERGRTLGRTQREVGLPEELAALYDESIAGVFETGQPHKLEFRLALPSGERQFEACHVPEFGAQGAIGSVLCVARDITERSRIERTLRETNEFLHGVIESSRDCIKVLDLEGRLQLVNDNGRRQLEIDDLSPFLNAEWLAFWGGTDRDAARAALDAARGGGVGSFEGYCPTRKGAPRWWDVIVTPILDAGGRPAKLLAVSRDITERKQDELAARRSAALARLLESLARAANEAVTPEAAMVACLERICAYGRWVIGRIAIYGESGPQGTAPRSIWHIRDRDRFAGFVALSDNRAPRMRGPLISRVLRDQAAVWIENLNEVAGFDRTAAAAAHGLRSAFAFPIIVRGTVVAAMEVFGEEARAQDPQIMGAAQSIASQLARIVEREWAHRANARMAAIVEWSQDAIISRDLDGTILTWNPAAERLFGYAAAEIVGRKMELLYPPELMEDISRRQQGLRDGRAAPAYETVRIAKGGRRVHVSTSPAPIRDSSGKVCGVSTIVRDITERKRAEEALRESVERFNQLAENIRQVFWISSLAGDRVVYISRAYEEIWGRSCESLYRDPRSWMDPIHPDDLPAVHAAQQRRSRGEHVDIEYRIVRPDGTVRWIKARSYGMRQGDGAPLACGIAEDVTTQKMAEQRRLTHAVHQRDALVREVHHRIKNNLQGVVGLLRQKIRQFPAAAPSIEEAIVQLQTVAVVYGLQGTRADGLLGLADMVEAICASAESLVGARVDRIFERKSQRPACVAGSEAVSVAVALNELVFNALKHQPAQAGKKHAQVALSEAADAAEIRIANRGRLPGRFDFSAGRAVGNGLELVQTLLGSPGAAIRFGCERGKVEVVLTLTAPLLAARGTAAERRREHDGASGEKAATASIGRG